MSDLFTAIQNYNKAQETNRPTRGVVKLIDGNHVNVLVRGSSTILRHVKAVGAAQVIGQEVILTWENGVPTAHMVGESAAPSSLVSLSRGPQGPQGPAGEMGPQGPAGTDGATGSVEAATTLGLIEQSATPAPPPVGTLLVYTKDDHKAYKQNSDGVEEEIGTGSGGGGAVLHHDQSGGTSDTYGALVGAIDGANTSFTTSKGQYMSGSLQVFLNGQLLIQGTAEGWVETDPSTGAFDLNDAPIAGDELFVSYLTTGSVIGSGDRTDQSGGTSDTYGVLAGAIDGVNTTFTASAGEYVSGALHVYLNGQLQTQGDTEDWVETDPSVGTFDFNSPPVPGDQITIKYKVHGAGAGDADTLDGYHADDFLLTNWSPSWIAPTLLNSWTNWGLYDLPPAGYCKRGHQVFIRGVVTGGVGSPSSIVFQLPTGYRPKYRQKRVVLKDDTIGNVDIDISGNVTFYGTTSTYLSLDGISFFV